LGEMPENRDRNRQIKKLQDELIKIAEPGSFNAPI
jgi:hypothetical protein